MSSDLIETLEVENRMLRARIDRMTREAADRQANAPAIIALQVVDDPAMLNDSRPMPWPIKGVRVDGDTVIVKVKGGNDAARWLCGEILRVERRLARLRQRRRDRFVQIVAGKWRQGQHAAARADRWQ